MLKKIFILIAALSVAACQCNADKLASSNVVTNKIQDNNKEYRRVFFAFNSSDIDGEAKKMLDHQLSWLKNNPEIQAIIEGYCDERGGEKYNLTLGQKRALAVKKYLTDNGIDEKRLKTVSYGKDHPLVPGSNEEAWAKNRRSVTIVKQ